MLELAVENGVKLVVLTTHSDCAAEKAASEPETRKRYPALAQAVDGASSASRSSWSDLRLILGLLRTSST